jgi:hypothetical protein
MNNFAELSFDQLLNLPNSVLEQLLQSPQLQVENEDFLFNRVVELITRDPNRKILLKSIYFPGVSPHLLINFFQNFPVEEIDLDFVESLKTRLF